MAHLPHLCAGSSAAAHLAAAVQPVRSAPGQGQLDNNTVQSFRYKVLRELKKIKLAWPDLNYATAKGVLILLPSIPAITPVEQAQLTS